MRKFIEIISEALSGMVAPDIGTLIEVDDPYKFGDDSDKGGTREGKRRYRVTGWYKKYDAPEAQWDLDTDDGFDAYFDYMLSQNKDPVFDGMHVFTGTRMGPDNCYLVACTRAEAEYVSGAGVAGTIQRVGDVNVVGRVKWTEEMIDQERQAAMRRVGKVM